MFKSLIDLLIEISDKVNFTTIIDFEISQIKVVDVNDYTIELFTIKIVHGEIYFYNEDYTLKNIYNKLSQVENMIYKTLLQLEFNIMLDNDTIDMDKFKKIMDCIEVFE